MNMNGTSAQRTWMEHLHRVKMRKGFDSDQIWCGCLLRHTLTCYACHFFATLPSMSGVIQNIQKECHMHFHILLQLRATGLQTGSEFRITEEWKLSFKKGWAVKHTNTNESLISVLWSLIIHVTFSLLACFWVSPFRRATMAQWP